MRVFPLIRLLSSSFLAASRLSYSMESCTTSLSSALSKKVPAYSRMLSGLSSRIFLTKSAMSPLISGCCLKYFSFSILNSNCHLVKQRIEAYLFLLNFSLLGPDDAFNTN